MKYTLTTNEIIQAAVDHLTHRGDLSKDPVGTQYTGKFYLNDRSNTIRLEIERAR